MSVLETESLSESNLRACNEALPALLARYRAGDQYAFTILYNKSADSVMAVLAGSLRHPRYFADFPDAIQVAMLLLSRRVKAFTTDGHVIRWLAKTARNVAINFHRRMRPTANSELVYGDLDRAC